MIPFTIDALNRAHTAAAPLPAPAPLAQPAAAPAPVAAAPAPEPEPARDPTARLAELLLKSEKASKKKKK
eukprot:COSAG04_NODE_231_length_19199_cov_263.690209_2_plen_70_part_00